MPAAKGRRLASEMSTPPFDTFSMPLLSTDITVPPDRTLRVAA
jgi:hypothetical protein